MRRRAIGAEVVAGGTSFRVWAPERERVAVVLDDRDVPLERERDGYFCGVIAAAGAGTLYRLRIDGARETYPDPASRFQPDGPHGPAQVIDPRAYRWRDEEWRGITAQGRVLYELHVGTFTREGTYAAAMPHLPALAEIGINTIELMPVHEFAGAFGWGYDGVDLWAPFHHYGAPDDLRRFVDEAHAHGIAVILDVVYNHFGPDGCYLKPFTDAYFTDKYENDWGEAINFDGRGVREFFIENAAHWIDEYHFDGLRLDATQSIHDDSDPHVLQDLAQHARAAAGDRSILLLAENEPQDARLLRDYGLDALWNDDWHHAARVALTGRAEAYYSDYCGTAQEFVSMATLGFLYQGQRYRWQNQRRGTPSHDLPPERFVCYLENHDQVANSASGERLSALTAPGRLRAMTTLLLLQPQTPMLFQGQEFGATTPFLYFADHHGELAESVRKGRHGFMQQFPSLRGLSFDAPEVRSTFERCKLDHNARNGQVAALHRDLLRLRPFRGVLRGTTLREDCLVLRWLHESDDRLLIVNLGRDLHFDPAPDPLLAPPFGFARWRVLWSSEWPQYGGSGMPEPDTDENWKITGSSAVVLSPAS